MPRGTTLRNIRIDDTLWWAVQMKAAKDGTNVSEVVRELLLEWVTPEPHRRRPRKGE
jgi:hypothetical protein